MHAIDTPDKQFKDGNGTSELGTILPAWWLNQIQAELLAVLTAAGIQPDKAKNQPACGCNQTDIQRCSGKQPTSADADKPLSAAMGKKISRTKRCLPKLGNGANRCIVD